MPERENWIRSISESPYIFRLEAYRQQSLENVFFYIGQRSSNLDLSLAVFQLWFFPPQILIANN